MAGSRNILSATRIRPARGVIVHPVERPNIVAVAVPGEQGKAGKDGSAASIQMFSIIAVASFTAQHGLPFAPRVWLVDPSGVEVDTDILHQSGQVTAIFAQPFTGTLYLR